MHNNFDRLDRIETTLKSISTDISRMNNRIEHLRLMVMNLAPDNAVLSAHQLVLQLTAELEKKEFDAVVAGVDLSEIDLDEETEGAA